MDSAGKFDKPCCQIIQTCTRNIEDPVALLKRILKSLLLFSQDITGQQRVLNAIFDQYDSHLDTHIEICGRRILVKMASTYIIYPKRNC